MGPDTTHHNQEGDVVENKCKIIVVVLVILVVVLGIYCWKKCGGENGESKTRYVVVVPREDPGKCTILPVKREMGTSGIEWVTFINFTDNDVKIEFFDSGAIEGDTTQTLPPDEPVKLKLKNPEYVADEFKDYGYKIVDGCTYEGPPAGPRVVIP